MKKSLATLLTVMLVSGISCSIYADELPESTGIVEDLSAFDAMDDESSGSSEEGYFGEELFVQEDVLDEEIAFEEDQAFGDDEAFDEAGLFGGDEILIEDGGAGDASPDEYGDGSFAAGKAETDLAGENRLAIDEKNFPDEIFRDYLKTNCDTDHDGFLSDEEIAAVQEIKARNYGIGDLSGIKNFTSLRTLDCPGNALESLDVSGCTALEALVCFNNSLKNLNVSGCTALKELSCNFNELTRVDVSDCAALALLNIAYNYLTDLDVMNCTQLEQLDVTNNLLTSLDVSGCTYLESLACAANNLTSLDVSGLTSLNSLFCYSNQLTALNVSGCTALETVDCFTNQLTGLDVSGCTGLWSLDCRENQLANLDVSSCTDLGVLSCSKNRLESLDIRNCDHLEAAYSSEKTEHDGYVKYRSGNYELEVDSPVTIVSAGYAQELIDRINAITPDADGFYDFDEVKPIEDEYQAAPKDIKDEVDSAGASDLLYNIHSAAIHGAEMMKLEPDPATGEYDAEKVKWERGLYEEYKEFILDLETEQKDLIPRKALQNLVTAELSVAMSELTKAAPADTDEFRALLTASEEAIENAKALDLVVTPAEEVYRKKLEEYSKVARPRADTPSAPSASEVQAVDDESITIKTTAGMEYSLDNGKTWKNGATTVVFKGLKPNTTYRLIRRVAKTSKNKASDPSNGYKVKTTNHIGRLLKIVDSLPDGSKLKEASRHDVNIGYLIYKKRLTSDQRKRADVKAAKTKLDAAKKILDYPAISFGNTKVQDKLKGKTTGTITLKEGNTLKLKVVSGTGAEISYSSNRKSVASVSGSGVVTAKKKGSVIITVQSQKSKVTVKIRVTEKS